MGTSVTPHAEIGPGCDIRRGAARSRAPGSPGPAASTTCQAVPISVLNGGTSRTSPYDSTKRCGPSSIWNWPIRSPSTRRAISTSASGRSPSGPRRACTLQQGRWRQHAASPASPMRRRRPSLRQLPLRILRQGPPPRGRTPNTSIAVPSARVTMTRADVLRPSHRVTTAVGGGDKVARLGRRRWRGLAPTRSGHAWRRRGGRRARRGEGGRWSASLVRARRSTVDPGGAPPVDG